MLDVSRISAINRCIMNVGYYSGINYFAFGYFKIGSSKIQRRSQTFIVASKAMNRNTCKN
jgi:hypothetical protein